MQSNIFYCFFIYRDFDEKENHRDKARSTSCKFKKKFYDTERGLLRFFSMYDAYSLCQVTALTCFLYVRLNN